MKDRYYTVFVLEDGRWHMHYGSTSWDEARQEAKDEREYIHRTRGKRVKTVVRQHENIKGEQERLLLLLNTTQAISNNKARKAT